VLAFVYEVVILRLSKLEHKTSSVDMLSAWEKENERAASLMNIDPKSTDKEEEATTEQMLTSELDDGNEQMTLEDELAQKVAFAIMEKLAREKRDESKPVQRITVYVGYRNPVTAIAEEESEVAAKNELEDDLEAKTN